MVEGIRDEVAGSQVKGKGKKKAEEGDGSEKWVGEMTAAELEERAKLVVAWFGKHYSSVFGEDGGLEDVQEGTGKVMRLAQQMLEEITMNLEGKMAEMEEEKQGGEAEAKVDTSGE